MFRRKKAPHLTTGERGERTARLYLRLHGYRILDCNYLCPMGEIDIVAMKSRMIIFVEVRTRRPEAQVAPMESITDLKLAHLVDAARYYLVEYRFHGSCRFDLITIRSGGKWKGRIRHYKDFFRTADERAVRGRSLKNWYRRKPRP